MHSKYGKKEDLSLGNMKMSLEERDRVEWKEDVRMKGERGVFAIVNRGIIDGVPEYSYRIAFTLYSNGGEKISNFTRLFYDPEKDDIVSRIDDILDLVERVEDYILERKRAFNER
jgi:hypothetical protein